MDIIRKINRILNETIVTSDVVEFPEVLGKPTQKTFPNTEEIRNYINRKKYKILFKDDKKIVVEIGES